MRSHGCVFDFIMTRGDVEVNVIENGERKLIDMIEYMLQGEMYLDTIKQRHRCIAGGKAGTDYAKENGQ